MGIEPAAQVASAEDGQLIINGPVTIENVVAVMEQGVALFGRHELVLDLSGITEVDSSAASLLLEWQRVALSRNCQLSFSRTPQQLQTLLRLYGISELINGNADSPDANVEPEKALS